MSTTAARTGREVASATEPRLRVLQSALDDKVRELARAHADLEQFAYVASHDLQEPLRMVSAYTQLLAERYRGVTGGSL